MAEASFHVKGYAAMRHKIVLPVSICVAICLSTATYVLAKANHQNVPQVVRVEGDVECVHDPSIAKDGDTWYLFSTGNGPLRKGELPIRCSQDLHLWKLCGYVFEQIPEWIKKQNPETKELWTPD